MQLIIVAQDILAPLGRQLAHALSLHDGHSGTYWTLKHYEDNESSLANQPVIFLGESKVARSYTEVLPVRFSDHGATCWFEGTKAVLLVESPAQVTVDNLARFERIVRGRVEELRHVAESSASVSAGDPPAGTKLATISSGELESEPTLGVRVAIAVQPVFTFGKSVVDCIVRTVNAGNRRRDYQRLQYRYVLDRFLREEFDEFVAGINGA